MKKWVLWTIFLAAICFAFFFTLLWLSQPPFRLNRKVIAKLPYRPDQLLVTDLDCDGHPEVLAVREGEPPFWIRSPLDMPNAIEIAGCKAIGVYKSANEVPMRSVPVLVGNKLRLLSWRNGKATFEPLPFVPDRAFDRIDVRQSEGSGRVFLAAYFGANVWVFVLTENGEWKFAGRLVFKAFQKYGSHIVDLADLDKDGKLDAICDQDLQTPLDIQSWVIWCGEKGKDKLGARDYYHEPLVSDLNGDGWVEVAMIGASKTNIVQIWRYVPHYQRLQVIAQSQTIELERGSQGWTLFDLDSDGLKEIMLIGYGNYQWFVFKLEDGKLSMWQWKRTRGPWYFGSFKGFMSNGEQNFLVTEDERFVFRFPPRIWIEGKGKFQWEWQTPKIFTLFWELPKGRKALSPANWLIREVTFSLQFAADIDGDGGDELIGMDKQGYRLYRFHRTKSGKLQWRSTSLGGKGLISNWALVKDGNRRGLCIAWEDGKMELMTMHKR
ncbi:MAG: VCBS repeat-containing protein [Armatimonadota bacterium]|nr:VCBS repeat-containing protein [Armatimonadota bacterium]MDW8144512.1 VCBS repeat-containing protein [Armatimonadota bacterium]